MKKFCKDYVELCKQTGAFYKKHWFGVIVLNVVLIAAEFGWIFRDSIKESIEDKLNSKKGIEETE